MPVRSPAVSALRVNRIPRSGSGFALLVACAPRRISTFRAFARRRGRLVAFWAVRLFRNERSALWLVELD
eukprot:503901-Pleurochrysis_carterae.AAC.1